MEIPTSTLFSAKDVKYENLNKVTPLSRYLALTLFVALPFLGAWIGYSYVPAKIIEIDRNVVEENQVVSTSTESMYEKELTINSIDDLQLVLTFEERKQVYDLARKSVMNYSSPGMEFSLVFNWKKGDWIKFSVIPENIETDNAQLFLYKENDQWILKGFGTAFPELYEKYPELFEKSSSSVKLSLDQGVIDGEQGNLSEGNSKSNTLTNVYLGISLQVPVGWSVSNNADTAIILLTPEEKTLYIGSRLAHSDYVPNTENVIINSDSTGHIDVLDAIEINTSDFTSHLLHEMRSGRGDPSYALEGEIVKKNQIPVPYPPGYYEGGHIDVLTVVTHNSGSDSKWLIDDVKKLIESISFID